MLTTKCFAAMIGVTSVWVLRKVAQTGSYYGIKPVRVQEGVTGAYMWDEQQAKDYLAGKKFEGVTE